MEEARSLRSEALRRDMYTIWTVKSSQINTSRPSMYVTLNYVRM